MALTVNVVIVMMEMVIAMLVFSCSAKRL